MSTKSTNEEEDVTPKPKTKRKRRKKNPEHYVNPAVLEQLIQDYYDCDVMSVELGESILKMATRMGFSSNFINYSYRDEMVGDALHKMLVTLDKKKYKYDPTRLGKTGKPGNAFQYFSKVAYHAMVNRIKIEKKNQTAIESYRDEMYDKIMSENDNGNKVKKQRPYDEENTYE